ncbi:hypothetical protein T8833_09520 [Staphylococcus aureus]|nr:hypothetical protein T8833_09520 [Staphylococcus aureus]
MDVTGKDLAKKIMNNLEKVSKAENPYDQKLLDENKSLNDDFKNIRRFAKDMSDSSIKRPMLTF